VSLKDSASFKICVLFDERVSSSELAFFCDQRLTAVRGVGTPGGKDVESFMKHLLM
jgi:hypothetical protein